MFILPKAIHRFNAIPIKISMVFLIEIEQIILKFVWNHIQDWWTKAVLRKKKARDLMLLDFKLYFRAIVIKLWWYWQKQQIHRTMEQNKKPPNKLTHKFMIKEPRNQSGKEKSFQLYVFGKTGQLHGKE